MSTDRTAEQWLALDDLPTELARVLTPGPYSHAIGHYGQWICVKCRTSFPDDKNIPKTCPVPDPITIDWNTAKYWQGKCEQEAYIQAAITVYEELYPDKLSLRKRVYCWLASLCKPEDAKLVLVIAAMAAERKEE